MRCPKVISSVPPLLNAGLLLVLCASSTPAQDFAEAHKFFLTGQFDDCLASCEKAASIRDDDWRLLHAETLLTVGRYPQAESVVSNALTRGNSIRLRFIGIETANFNGQPDVARKRLREINDLAGARPWAYREPADLVALGRAALKMGADPKVVLERLFDAAQKADPSQRDAYLAAGELALEKHDFAIAAKKFSEAVKKFTDDADALCGLARAYQPNAQARMGELLEAALTKNANHVPTMLMLADHAIDAEEYAEADKMLARALKVNPWQPEAWAYRAVLAHLQNNSSGEAQCRSNALKFWSNNPNPDYLIGLKLSQKYRFAEGAECQQRALAFDSAFLPAGIQLAQDFLRLGVETEGWKLAEDVHRNDGYDVTAYNLVTLRGTMEKFRTLTNADFVLRMSANEAALYGDSALALLQRARSNLTAKYGIKLESPTFVEIFPEHKDFGVRTFGMPHNPGFLGVCFGRVVTATSPAAAGGNPANWEAVLWHEFTHVVTLQMTRNKMPRWLSEGISVYEELQTNPAWGQRMNPRYREMVLGDDLTPVSELSGAFLSPKSDLHVQFAYYESELVVEFLVGKFGFDKLKAILRDLGEGVDINDAIPKHTAPMKQVEKEFAAFAKSKAEALAPGLDWEKSQAQQGFRRQIELDLPLTPALHVLTNAQSASKSSDKPNYWSLMDQARRLVSEKKWAEAKLPLQTLIELYPGQADAGNAYSLLASAHRGLNETTQERSALEKWADLSADALDAYLRLMELAEAASDWKTAALNAKRCLAVNPLIPQPYRGLGRASEELGETTSAITAYQKLLLLDPADPADVHFRLAKLLRKTDDPAAKRHVLQALEEAPRFREAHRLLLELARTNGSPTNSVTGQHP